MKETDIAKNYYFANGMEIPSNKEIQFRSTVLFREHNQSMLVNLSYRKLI